tara:strand:- start:39 stop:215 length:177 start_codon:yes stop_codon:yes gene_type:complete
MGSKRPVQQRKYDLSVDRRSGGMRLTEDRVSAAADMFCGNNAPHIVVDSQTGKQKVVW